MTHDFLGTFFLVLCVLVLARSLYGLIAFFVSIQWLRKSRDLKKDTEKFFVIVIPVLWEQRILRSTVEWFLNLKYPADKMRIVLVTTEKEFSRSDLPNEKLDTVQLASDLERKYAGLVRHMHYPYADGKMVDQVNYAFARILDEASGTNDEDVFLALYNADSRPHPETLRWVSALSGASGGRVFQQSAIFFENFRDLLQRNNFLSGRLLQANAILQTRWTLTHEIPRLLRQVFSLTKLKSRLFLTHCVGHGLFLRKDLVMDLKGMPTGTVTEDLSFGFVLSLLGEPVRPLPVLESAEMPHSVSGALRQKYVWFFGPMDHLAYARSFLKSHRGRASWWLVIWFVVQGLLPALAWLVSGWILLYLLIFPFFAGSVPYYVFGWGSIFLYLTTFLLTVQKSNFLDNLSARKSKMNFDDILWTMIFTFPMVILHGLPPLVSVAAKVRSTLMGREPDKPKTER